MNGRGFLCSRARSIEEELLEAMKWGKKEMKKGLTWEQVVTLLIKKTCEVVQNTCQDLKNQLDADEQSKLPKVDVELFYFFVFAIDYLWQKDLYYTQEQKSIFEKLFSAHLDILCGDDEQGQAMWDTLQERFIAYGQIVNEQRSESAKLMGFGMKLSEYCEINNAILLLLVPDLLMKALELVSVFKDRGDK